MRILQNNKCTLVKSRKYNNLVIGFQLIFVYEGSSMRTFLIVVISLILMFSISYVIFNYLDNPLGGILVGISNGIIIVAAIHLKDKLLK